MGQACVKQDEEFNKSKQANSEISKSVNDVKKTMSKEVKLLLLGAGESGKSTIFKQMKIIHHKGYTREECMVFRDVIYSNTLSSMKNLILAAQKFGFPLEEFNKDRSTRIASLDSDALLNAAKIFTPEIAQDISVLWKDKAIIQAYQRRSEFQLNDSAEYYFEAIERISTPEYCPSQDDVLRSRSKTTGIVHAEFDYGGLHFRMYDVGGQRSERKKWIHCFQNVTSVIFVTSLSEYDQRCYEDDTTLRMKESLLLFDEICNSRWFLKTAIILFLNKVDLFQEKIKAVDLKVCFPEYTGGCDFENAWKYVQKKFCELNKNEKKQIYTHLTCATDTKNIQTVFECVKDIILQNNLQDNGLIS